MAAFNMTNYTNMAGGLTMGDITKSSSHSSILHHRHFYVPTKKNRQQMTHVVSSVFATLSSSSSSSFSSSSYTSMASSSSPSMFSSSSSSSSCNLGLALMWREIHGSNNWEGLLNPLHPLLQHEIIRYGNFVTACYDAFDLNPNSTRYLNCKFGKKKLLGEVGLQNSGYEVTKYIYATPDITIPTIGPNGSSCGRWIGFVAISTDENVANLGRRDIVISFRGTVTNPEWLANLMSSMSIARLDPNNSRPEVKVESGFLSLYTAEESESRFRVSSCREQLLSELSRLMNKCKGENLSITLAGHSMGSSLAILLAYDISELGLNRLNNDESVPITVFSFGGPRVGNSAFKQRCDELGIKVLRIVNVNDPVTKLPGILFNENFRVLGELPWSYAHVGVELALDFFNVQNPCCVHDLEAYLSLIKCPLNLRRGDDDTAATNWPELLQKAIGFLLSAYTLSNMLPLLHAATEIVYLIPVVFPSQWTNELVMVTLDRYGPVAATLVQTLCSRMHPAIYIMFGHSCTRSGNFPDRCSKQPSHELGHVNVAPPAA